MEINMQFLWLDCQKEKEKYSITYTLLSKKRWGNSFLGFSKFYRTSPPPQKGILEDY